MGDSVAVGFYDLWAWSIFVVAGLLLILLELIVGVETGFDLAVLGSILVIAGLATIPFNSWWITTVSAIILSVLYVAVGRKYIHRRRWKDGIKTNIDAIMGKTGIVLNRVAKNADGLVKVGNEEWRARAGEDIEDGEEIVIVGVSGATLIVRRKEVT